MARRKTNRRRLLSRGQRGGSQPTTGQRGGSKKKTTRRSSKAPALNITSLGQMDSLKKLMKNTSVMMVFVYADWCGHCQHFKPEWKNLERLPERNVPMVSIRDDVFPKSPLKENVEVEGYPTVAIVNTAQNVTVNVPNREPESLKKLLVNNENLTSPPPPNMTNKELENKLNNMNISAKETNTGKTIIDVEPDPSPIKETIIDENINNTPNEITPPPQDSIVRSIEREGSRQLGGGRSKKGLYNALREYNNV